MIPKIIHYVWLGKGEKPEIFNKCYESWKKYCPDYEIMLWDESNVDLDSCKYVREAYDAKKYAFASDVIRLQKLYEYGGVYLDIDVELLKPIDDLLDCKCFTGLECGNNIAPGLILGSEKDNLDFKNIIEDYMHDSFVVNGKLNLTTICERFTQYYFKYGFVYENKKQEMQTGMIIYPMEYFCPMDNSTMKLNVTPKTYSIHWYNNSWAVKQSLFKKIKIKFKQFFRKLIGDKNYYKLKQKVKNKNKK